jgi:hypothetical protein
LALFFLPLTGRAELRVRKDFEPFGIDRFSAVFASRGFQPTVRFVCEQPGLQTDVSATRARQLAGKCQDQFAQLIRGRLAVAAQKSGRQKPLGYARGIDRFGVMARGTSEFNLPIGHIRNTSQAVEAESSRVQYKNFVLSSHHTV